MPLFPGLSPPVGLARWSRKLSSLSSLVSPFTVIEMVLVASPIREVERAALDAVVAFPGGLVLRLVLHAGRARGSAIAGDGEDNCLVPLLPSFAVTSLIVKNGPIGPAAAGTRRCRRGSCRRLGRRGLAAAGVGKVDEERLGSSTSASGLTVTVTVLVVFRG